MWKCVQHVQSKPKRIHEHLRLCIKVCNSPFLNSSIQFHSSLFFSFFHSILLIKFIGNRMPYLKILLNSMYEDTWANWIVKIHSAGSLLKQAQFTSKSTIMAHRKFYLTGTLSRTCEYFISFTIYVYILQYMRFSDTKHRSTFPFFLLSLWKTHLMAVKIWLVAHSLSALFRWKSISTHIFDVTKSMKLLNSWTFEWACTHLLFMIMISLLVGYTVEN